MGKIDEIAALAARLGGQAPPPQLKEGVDVLSLFDGIGAARAALDEAGIPVRNYYSSEINPYSKDILHANYPDVVDLGDVRSLRDPPKNVDLMCGGSPCQDLSRANMNERAGLEGDKSSLFWDFVRVRDEAQPKHFLFENVLPRGSVADKDVRVISDALGVDPVLVDAKDFSAMRRPRLWWTDLDVPLYGGSEATLRNALSADVDPKYFYSERAVQGMHTPKGQSGKTPFDRHGMRIDDPKARTVTASFKRGQPHNSLMLDDGRIRKLTPEEIERLFGFPEGYTSGVSDTRRYEALGNSWSVPAAAHILRGLLPD